MRCALTVLLWLACAGAWGACDPLPGGGWPTTCARLTWTYPTQNVDGSALVDLFAFPVYRRCGPEVAAARLAMPVASTMEPTGTEMQSWDDESPPLGQTCWYSLTAMNVAGEESARTGEVSKSFSLVPQITRPNAPSGVLVTLVEEPSVAISIDGTPSHATVSEDDANGELVWSHTCGASANKLIVQIAAGAGAVNSRSVGSVTYNGVALAQSVEQDQSWSHSEIWYLDNPSTGAAYNIVVRMADYPTPTYAADIAAGAVSLIGAAAGAARATNSASGSTANPSVTVSGIVADDFVVGAYMNDVGSNGTTTPGGTELWEDEDFSGGDNDASAQYYVATGTSQAVSWTATATGAGWAIVAAAFAPAVSTPITLLMSPPAPPMSYSQFANYPRN